MTSRANLCTNPSFEVSLAGWSAFGPSATVAQSSVWANVGTKSALLAAPSQGQYFAGLSTYSPVGITYNLTTVVGQNYTVKATVRSDPSVAANTPMVITAAGNTGSQAPADSSPHEIAVSFVATATTTAVTVQSVSATHDVPATGHFYNATSVFIDSVLMETPSAGTYFDGSFAGCSWTGTAGLSTSTYTSPPPSIAVSNDPNNAPPRNYIYVSGVSGTSAIISRVDPDGAIRNVRGGEPATVVSGVWVGYDYEAPYGQPVSYVVTPTDGSTGGTTVAPALAVTQAWLVHPGVPALSVPISGIKRGDRTFASGSARHTILGSKFPKTQTDGARKSGAFQLSIRTKTAADNAAVRGILANSVPLLVQLAFGFTGTTSWFYVDIDAVTEHEVTTRFQDAQRVWTLDCMTVDRPAGGIAAQRTYADVLSDPGVATYADLVTRYATYAGLLTGVAGT